MAKPDLQRVDLNRLTIPNPFEIDVSLFANETVPIEQAAIDELQRMLSVQKTVEQFAKTSPESFGTEPRISRVAVTPDFHKAQGIPVGTVLETVGFVVPQAIGNDVNCGMRMHLTGLDADQLNGHIEEIETACRHMFFEAGRRIPMHRVHREAMLLEGVEGLYETVDSEFDEGIWSYFHRQPREATLARIERRGNLKAKRVLGLDNYLGESNLSRDSQIGSIGGGNHFVEIQRVEKILDGTVAHAWGLRTGMVTVMVHTGSVSVGSKCGTFYRDKVREIFPANLKHPDNGIFVLPIGEQHQKTSDTFWDTMHNAANFAFANRMFLGLMAWSCLEKCIGPTTFDLLYDAPHNMVWREYTTAGERIVHRKGACPARGLEAMQGTPFGYYGEPVLVPGSMGASSFILAGNGLDDSLCSAAHGAGRAVSRGATMSGYQREFDEFLKHFRIVTPVDFRRQDIKRRKDIVDKKLAELRQEAPFAYKGIGPVIDTIRDAGIARPVAELKPIMTIKG